MDEIQVGQIINYIIENHKDNKLTTVKQIKQKFMCKNMKETIIKVKEKILEFDIDLVGFNENKIISCNDAEKLFLIKCNNHSDFCDTTNNSLLILFTFINLEGDKILLKNLVYLFTESNIFESQKEIVDFLGDAKASGYIQHEKIEEEVYVLFNWRFYIEYENFNPGSIYKKMLKQEK